VRDGEERGRERPRPRRVHQAEARRCGRREVHERVVADHGGQRRPDGARDRELALQPQPPTRRVPVPERALLVLVLAPVVARRRCVRAGAGHGRRCSGGGSAIRMAGSRAAEA